MTTAYRLIGNRDLAAAYRGEAQRLLFHLKQSLGETPSGGLHRTYPDGTKISIRKFFDDDIILIDSPFFGEKPQPEKPYQGDVIVFYSTPAGEYRVAVTDTRIFGAEDPPAIASWLTSKWS